MNRKTLVSMLVGLALASAAVALEPEHQETRDLMAFVEKAAALVAEQGPDACEAFKTPEWWQGDIYVFVVDTDGIAVCNPARPSLEGTNVRELRDPDGKPIIELFLRQVQGEPGAGWVHYLWPRPGQSMLHWKSSYLKRVAHGGKDYVVGAGSYQLPMEKSFVVERVEAAAKLLAEHGEAAAPMLRAKSGGFIFLDAYVFAMTSDGVMKINPKFPELEGKMVLDVQDNQGVYPGREILKTVESQESGWVSYDWPRTAETRPLKKETYVKKVQVGDETWIVASGVYVDE